MFKKQTGQKVMGVKGGSDIVSILTPLLHLYIPVT